MADVSLILVTYNSANVAAEALASALNEPRVRACFLVDNASSDGTAARMKERFPQITVIQNAENKGFGVANNLALEKVVTPFALLLNPDAVLREGALGLLLEAAERYPEAAIIAPALTGADGTPEQNFKRNVFHRERHRAPWRSTEGDVSAEWISGAVWLVRVECLRKIGCFDPAIFFYYEDDDLCMRLRAAGYDLVVVHAAAAVHGKGKSSGSGAALEGWKQRQMITSRLYLERKYRGARAARLLQAKILLESCCKAACYGLLARKKKARKHCARARAALKG